MRTRETISFFGSTAAVDGWRVCIVDTVDELNPNAANALLKILEEPPQRSLFLLVSHSPARALPTILSRCRKLPLRPLSTDDVTRAAMRATDIAADDLALTEAASASEGSVSRALTLLGGDALKLQQRTAALLATLPQVDPRELHALGDALGTSDRVASGLHRRRRALGEREAARWRCQRKPSAPCTAGGGMGKRSSAPRATHKTTIWSGSRWYSRYSGCSRKRRGSCFALLNPDNFTLGHKGIRSGDAQEKSFKKKEKG